MSLTFLRELNCVKGLRKFVLERKEENFLKKADNFETWNFYYLFLRKHRQFSHSNFGHGEWLRRILKDMKRVRETNIERGLDGKSKLFLLLFRISEVKSIENFLWENFPALWYVYTASSLVKNKSMSSFEIEHKKKGFCLGKTLKMMSHRWSTWKLMKLASIFYMLSKSIWNWN